MAMINFPEAIARARLAVLLMLGLPWALSLVGCGGSMRQVQGANFELNSQEDTLAEQYEQQEPRQAGPPARCEYWKRRTHEAMGDHAMGMLIWHGNRFVTLREWANAKANQACSALAEHLAKQKKEADEARRRAATEARVAAEEARKEAAARAEARRAAEAEQAKVRAREVALHGLEELENGVVELKKGPWNEEHLVLYKHLFDVEGEIDKALKTPGAIDTWTDSERARTLAAIGKHEKFGPAFEKAREAFNARADKARAAALKRVVPDAWLLMKTKLVAPASAQLVSADVILTCPNGFIIRFGFDSQNRMGAMLRGQGVVKISSSGKAGVAWIDGEDVNGMSPFELFLRAAQRGECSGGIE